MIHRLREMQRHLVAMDVGQLRTAVQRRWRRLSREALLGLGLLALCLGFYLAAVRPAQAHLDQLRAEQQAHHEQRQRTARALRVDQDTPGEQLAAYYKFFPGTRSAPQWLEKIYNAARAQHLVLDQGEYRPIPERTGRLLRYQITLPLRGSYAQLRNFLATVLTDVPAASLDHISVERHKIGDPTINAKIKLTLYLVQEG
jgi:hypothetical protein